MSGYALITGASSGLGLALAEALARRGRNLMARQQGWPAQLPARDAHPGQQVLPQATGCLVRLLGGGLPRRGQLHWILHGR